MLLPLADYVMAGRLRTHIIEPSTLQLPSFTAQEEANIIETGTNSAGVYWDVHTGLIDGEGLAGTSEDVRMFRCGVSSKDSKPRAWFYMKLATPGTVMKLQLARRTEGSPHQGKNVKVQVGSSPQYNVNDPVCTEIAQLSGIGLVEYECSQFHAGQYVIISNDQAHLTICEARVFVNDAGKGNMHCQGASKDYQSDRSN